MPRFDIGDRVKGRVKRLLEVLLDHAEKDLSEYDRVSFDCRWQEKDGAHQLVIQTKLRFVEALTAKDSQPGKLSKAQITEALKRLEDFLGVLEDNRTKTQGKEEWHFTLKLWNQGKEKNLWQFEEEWQQRKAARAKRPVKTAAMPQPETSLPTSQNNLPWAGATKFVGRDEELARLHQLLQESDRVAIAAISGMGGVGKTELAIQYAQIHLSDYPGGACWIFAKAGDVGLKVIEFAKSHFDHFFIPEGLSAAAQVSFCWQHWHPGKVLVVLDDVDKYDEIKDYLPPQSSRFKVLITTRLQGLVPQQLSLEVLSPAAALNLLAERIGAERISATKGKGFAAAIGASAAEQLCEWLGYLPLGIQLVGRYLAEQPDLSLERMLARLQKQKLAHSALIRQESDGNWNLTAQRGIKAAFELTWQRLDEQAQQLGCLLSIFALAPIPWAQVESVVGQIYLPGGFLQALMQGSQGDAETQVVEMVEEITEAFAEARAILVKWHLLQRADVDIYRLHQLVREFFRDKLAGLENGDSFKEVFCQVMVAVAKQIPQQPTIDLIEAIAPAIPHIAETATTWQDFLSDEDLINPFGCLSRFYEGQGLYTQAEPWRVQCLSVAQTRFGEAHPDVATSLNNLALLYESQGRYSEAEPLYLQALEMSKQLLGEVHPDVAASLNNLAGLYRSQGRYNEAEILFLQALEIAEKTLGLNHPHTVIFRKNLEILRQEMSVRPPNPSN